MVSYVKEWIAAGIPIDGIGAQTHLMAGEAKNVPASLAVLCAAAPQCAITEMDIVNAVPADYVTAIKACVDIANCVGVTVWGVRPRFVGERRVVRCCLMLRMRRSRRILRLWLRLGR
jgi:endo-1,4-beta-xylanase